jgi:hypothetical protein
MSTTKEFSFDLDERIVKTLATEFDPQKAVEQFAADVTGKKGGEVETIAKEVFEKYGKDWMKRSLELGEQYPDRTYEVLKAAAEKTGALNFPHAPQRAIEIAYCSTKGILGLPIVENNSRRLVYRMKDCPTYSALRDRCGQEVANTLPCQYACLAGCDTLKQELDLTINIEMEASIPKDGFCQFALNRAR